MDRFSQAQSGQELLEVGKKVIQQLKPDYYEAIAALQLVDEQAWVKGAITPIVRHPVGHLPSGAVVMGIGDVVLLHDPIAAQGANNATKMAHLVRQRIIEHGNQRFDASWMQRVSVEVQLLGPTDSPQLSHRCTSSSHKLGVQLPTGLDRLKKWWETVAKRESVRAIAHSQEFYLERYGQFAQSLVKA